MYNSIMNYEREKENFKEREQLMKNLGQIILILEAEKYDVEDFKKRHNELSKLIDERRQIKLIHGADYNKISYLAQDIGREFNKAYRETFGKTPKVYDNEKMINEFMKYYKGYTNFENYKAPIIMENINEKIRLNNPNITKEEHDLLKNKMINNLKSMEKFERVSNSSFFKIFMGDRPYTRAREPEYTLSAVLELLKLSPHEYNEFKKDPYLLKLITDYSALQYQSPYTVGDTREEIDKIKEIKDYALKFKNKHKIEDRDLRQELTKTKSIREQIESKIDSKKDNIQLIKNEMEILNKEIKQLKVIEKNAPIKEKVKLAKKRAKKENTVNILKDIIRDYKKVNCSEKIGDKKGKEEKDKLREHKKVNCKPFKLSAKKQDLINMVDKLNNKYKKTEIEMKKIIEERKPEEPEPIKEKKYMYKAPDRREEHKKYVEYMYENLNKYKDRLIKIYLNGNIPANLNIQYLFSNNNNEIKKGIELFEYVTEREKEDIFNKILKSFEYQLKFRGDGKRRRRKEGWGEEDKRKNFIIVQNNIINRIMKRTKIINEKTKKKEFNKHVKDDVYKIINEKTKKKEFNRYFDL